MVGAVTGLVDDSVDGVEHDQSKTDADGDQTQKARCEHGDEDLPLVFGHLSPRYAIRSDAHHR